jgi:hypothetical protein
VLAEPEELEAHCRHRRITSSNRSSSAVGVVEAAAVEVAELLPAAAAVAAEAR